MKGSGGVWFAVGLVVLGTVLVIDRSRPDVDIWQQIQHWWPVGLVILGIVGLVSLVPAPIARRGPFALIVFGAMLLVLTTGQLPGWLGPYLWPVLLIVAGLTILVRQANREPGVVGPIGRMWLIAQSRTLEWRITDPPVLIMRAVASGCVVRLDGAGNRKLRLEITALLTGVDVMVPEDWTVHLVPRGWSAQAQNLANEAESPEKADLQVVVLSVFSGVEVRKS